MNYLVSIGLECHVQLTTKTKLFTGVSNYAKGAEAGSLVGPLCLGLPGSLPVINQRAVELAILAGLALEAEVANYSRFDRKHYFYPDLPLGYQITQHQFPIVGPAQIEVVTAKDSFKVRLIRAHLEADAGKLAHPTTAQTDSLLDLNRVGTPLLEIVSQPDIHSPSQAKAYAREIALRMRYAGVSDCDLFAGNMRFDANVSLSPDKTKLGTRTEIKNLNSFRNLERALTSEIDRQAGLLDAGKTIVQETRGWHETKQTTFSQRSKEQAHDYRYMPDPDIPPLTIKPSLIAKLAKSLPATPKMVRQTLAKLDLPTTVSETIVDNLPAAQLMLKLPTSKPKLAKIIANWLAGEIQRLISSQLIASSALSQAQDSLVKLASLVESGQLSASAAKDLLAAVIKDPKSDPKQLAQQTAGLQLSDSGQLLKLVKTVIKDNPQAVADAAADPKAIGFLVGQVMAASRGRANPKLVAGLIKQQLTS